MISKLVKAGRIALTAVAVIISWLVLCWDTPPMRIDREASAIHVNVQTFGEYQSTVDHIRLTDLRSGTVIWELVSQGGDAQLFQFVLKEGTNPAQLNAAFGSYSIAAPKDTDHFILHSGTEYRLELWGGTTFFSKTGASFEFSS
jgi:hypothetical protein